MAITKPMLPPKSGYVEVEVDGKRTYRNVSTGVLIDDEVTQPTMDERVSTLEETTAQQTELLNIIISGDTGEASE